MAIRVFAAAVVALAISVAAPLSGAPTMKSRRRD